MLNCNSFKANRCTIIWKISARQTDRQTDGYKDSQRYTERPIDSSYFLFASYFFYSFSFSSSSPPPATPLNTGCKGWTPGKALLMSNAHFRCFPVCCFQPCLWPKHQYSPINWVSMKKYIPWLFCWSWPKALGSVDHHGTKIKGISLFWLCLSPEHKY